MTRESAAPPRRMVVEVIDDATAAMFRAMTPAQRVAVAARAHRTARTLVSAGVRHAHPNWTAEQISSEVLRRMSRGTR